ncbi:MAG TPA: flagellar basal body rod protein FlgC [Burkholderiales bacterium]
MDTYSAFEISAAGMNAERMRLDVSAMNLANANTTRGPDGTLFKPLQVVARPGAPFAATLEGVRGMVTPPPQLEVQPLDLPPREVFEPGHPDADAQGFVAYPAVNPVSEMIHLIEITRAYEANVRALNAAKAMALKALEIGGDR